MKCKELLYRTQSRINTVSQEHTDVIWRTVGTPVVQSATETEDNDDGSKSTSKPCTVDMHRNVNICLKSRNAFTYTLVERLQCTTNASNKYLSSKLVQYHIPRYCN